MTNEQAKQDSSTEKAVEVMPVVMRIIEVAYTNTEHRLFSDYAGYEFELEREDENDQWYIQVRPIDESYLYNGWWRDSEGESKEAAVREALRGAQILGA